ncbi:MAG: hypothetical protein LBD60_01900 [Puniceicoccales bacterium]|nr:hypothetical protein [Puniceicoccales bacterium]
MSRDIWIVLGCIAFWGCLDGSTDPKVNISGIIAIKKGDFDIEFRSCSDDIDLDTPFMVGSSRCKIFRGRVLGSRHISGGKF